MGLALGIYLDDVGEDNGPMMAVPGSHRGPVFDHHSDGAFCGGIDPGLHDVGHERAAQMTGPAGTFTLHHVRAVHGSALNRSNRPRRLLLYSYFAADAWPLMGLEGATLEEFDKRICRGRPTLEPRLEPAPVRMPLPVAPKQGSIYENQKTLTGRFFDQYETSPETGREASVTRDRTLLQSRPAAPPDGQPGRRCRARGLAQQCLLALRLQPAGAQVRRAAPARRAAGARGARSAGHGAARLLSGRRCGPFGLDRGYPPLPRHPAALRPAVARQGGPRPLRRAGRPAELVSRRLRTATRRTWWPRWSAPSPISASPASASRRTSRGWPRGYRGVDVEDGYGLLMSARSIKTPAEVDLMRAATAVNRAAIEESIGAWTPGMTWRDLCAAYHAAALARGGFVHDPGAMVLANGSDSPVPVIASEADDYELEPGMRIMFDCHGTKDRYCWDGGKTWIVGSDGADAARPLARATADAMAEIEALMVPGARISALQAAGPRGLSQARAFARRRCADLLPRARPQPSRPGGRCRGRRHRRFRGRGRHGDRDPHLLSGRPARAHVAGGHRPVVGEAGPAESIFGWDFLPHGLDG